MTNQVNQAFEDFYNENKHLYTDTSPYGIMLTTFQASTKASEIEINSLKEQVNELEEEVIKYQSIVSEQKIIIHAIKGECKDMGVTDICVALGRKYIEIVELQAHVNQLREAIEISLSCVDEEINPRNYNGEILTKFINDYGQMVDILQKSLTATTTQSLIEHDNEIIHHCADTALYWLDDDEDKNELIRNIVESINKLKVTP